ncbi:leucine-rich repeat domain-containing protein [Tessaracoccus sp. HDW20]|uniref:leucine-rich repeat domain-containing protein n=1 Tax=Tessaracoccus coleopterorum TaxID=2714950 RepID=UPI0018D3DEC8|nr:hypothetical protein [Tessaracoccus coleopterorum]NHB85407.1 leucine-rich repeat domain-containing protein [Tessaracoccus coleopterorum]
MTALYTLYISDNPVTDVAPLGKLPNLNTVEAIGTDVRSVAPLKDAAGLVFLDLSSSTRLDASSLTSLTQLRGLSIADSNLSSLTPLTNLKALLILDVASNPDVTSAAPLGGMTSLSILSITSTGIGDLTPIGKLTSLTQLDIDRTPVQRVAPLASLTKLQVLSAVGVSATDWQSLDALVAGGLTILR